MPHNENEDTVRSTENIKQHRSIREILRHNAGLKILSVVFAILLWCARPSPSAASPITTYR